MVEESETIGISDIDKYLTYFQILCSSINLFSLKFNDECGLFEDKINDGKGLFWIGLHPHSSRKLTIKLHSKK